MDRGKVKHFVKQYRITMNKKEYFKREGSKLDNTLTITITSDEKQRIQQVAKDRKMSVSQFARQSIRNEILR